MGSLATAAQLAHDTTAGGFRDQVQAALVNQARTKVTDAATPGLEKSYAMAVIRNPDNHVTPAAWAVATDSTVVAAGTAVTEAQVNTALVKAWPYLAQIDAQ